MTLDLYADIRSHVLDALRALAPDLPQDLADRVEVAPARDPAHGDMATNAAMVCAKALRLPPPKIAAALIAHLGESPGVSEVAAAGPGFVNIRLEKDALRALLPAVLGSGEDFGRSAIGSGRRINVEYVSANPTGPMHIGHCRGAVVGDALANLLAKAGWDVTKEYYINDAGAQVDTLGRSTYLRYKEALGEDIGEIPEGLYPGEYLKEVGAAIAKRDGARWIGKPEADWLPDEMPYLYVLESEPDGRLAGTVTLRDLVLAEVPRVLDSGVCEDGRRFLVVEHYEGPTLRDLLKQEDLDVEDELFIRREIGTNGKSRAFVNDTPVNLDQLRKLTGQLVDLHRQFDTLALSELDFQREVLDAREVQMLIAGETLPAVTTTPQPPEERRETQKVLKPELPPRLAEGDNPAHA